MWSSAIVPSSSTSRRFCSKERRKFIIKLLINHEKTAAVGSAMRSRWKYCNFPVDVIINFPLFITLHKNRTGGTEELSHSSYKWLSFVCLPQSKFQGQILVKRSSSRLLSSVIKLWNAQGDRVNEGTHCASLSSQMVEQWGLLVQNNLEKWKTMELGFNRKLTIRRGTMG